MDVMTVSSKGQITIPGSARKKMKVSQGDKLAYVVFDDTLIIKPIRMPSEKEFEKSLDQAEKWAVSVGLTEEDVNDAIKSARRKKRG